jgi:hypothetical protein
MNNGVRHVSESLRRTIVAVAFAMTITAAFATSSAFAVITATLPPTGAHVFVPSEQQDSPFSASQVRGCVVQEPNGHRRGWVPGASAMTGAQNTPDSAKCRYASRSIPWGLARFGCPICRGPVVNSP